jgi:diguanylate cyclase (GGDEF)-like protein/PAS domain S-box-containing protein
MSDRPVRVLIVDDDEDDVVLTEALLREVAGTTYDVEWQPDVARARVLIAAGAHDVALVDYRMGAHDGLTLVREGVEAGTRMPLILLTGQGGRETDVAAMEVGASDFLVKAHISSDVLERSIRYACDRARTMERLRASEGRVRSLVESARDAILVLDAAGSVLSWNGAASKLFGYSEDEARGRSFGVLVPRAAPGDHESWASAAWLERVSAAQDLEGHRCGGGTFPVEAAVARFDTPEGWCSSVILRDIRERRELEERLRNQALHDALTGLPNRTLFRDRLERERLASLRSGGTFAVMFIDLDDFKGVNDTLGHTAGDRLLVDVARHLRRCLRDSDTAARLGGDEFGALLPGVSNEAEVRAVAARVASAIGDACPAGNATSRARASIGVVLADGTAGDCDLVLREADVAMYRAKARGKGCWALADLTLTAPPPPTPPGGCPPPSCRPDGIAIQ